MYVDIDSRDKFYLRTKTPINPENLAYQITQLLTAYATANQGKEGASFALLNEVMGAIEISKQEFYRRAVVPHLSFKIQENGDLYT